MPDSGTLAAGLKCTRRCCTTEHVGIDSAAAHATPRRIMSNLYQMLLAFDDARENWSSDDRIAGDSADCASEIACSVRDRYSPGVWAG